MTERMVDLYAAEIGMDPAEVRRKNMVPNDQFPFDNRVGFTLDSGNYEGTLDLALEMVGYSEIAQRKAEALQRGKRLGVGIASFVAICGVGPSTRMSKEGMLGGTWDTANIRVYPTGEVALTIGAKSTGQSHQTTFAQIAAEELGIDINTIQVFHSDTQRSPYGQGTYGSRSFSVCGPAVQLAAQKVKAKIVRMAAHMFEEAEENVLYEDGKVFAKNAPEKTKTFQEMALAIWYGWNLPTDFEPGLDETSYFDPADFNYPFGTHVAVVEIDEKTGEIELVRYIAVNDAGTIGNPLVVNGQYEGSIAHAIGQAFMEHAIYDEQGHLLTNSFQTYAIPRAADVPHYELGSTVTPTPHNKLGAKGAGEIATVPPAAAIVNAACDALSYLGVKHIDMPLTPEKVWQTIHDAKSRNAAASNGHRKNS